VKLRTSKKASLAISTFCLGCVIALASIGTATPASNSAASLFGAALPLGVSAWFLEALREGTVHTRVNTMLRLVAFAAFGAAQLTAVVGVYWLFRHVSSEAGRVFLTTSLLCYISLAIVLSVVGETNRRMLSESERRQRLQPMAEEGVRAAEPGASTSIARNDSL
jgi:hypothetical protein